MIEIKLGELFKCGDGYFYIEFKEYNCNRDGETNRYNRDKYLLKVVAKEKYLDKINRLLHFIRKNDINWDDDEEKLKLIKEIKELYDGDKK